jgi:hypothetical protein
MSGAQDLADFYSDEIAVMNEMDDSDMVYYRNFDIATISKDHNCALMRRNPEPGIMNGEYLFRNLATGDETYVCPSYTRESGITFSGFGEYYAWIDGNTLTLQVLVNDEGHPFDTYTAEFKNSAWQVSKA